MDRSVALGHKGVIMTGEPAFWGMPKLADPCWDPMWAAAQERGLSINFHIGSDDMSTFDAAFAVSGRHANYVGFGVQFGLGNVRVIINLFPGWVCHRFPELNFVPVGSGTGWLPFAMNHLDWQWSNWGVPAEHPEYDLLPSEYFKRQMYGTSGLRRTRSRPRWSGWVRTGSFTRLISRIRRACRRSPARRPSCRGTSLPKGWAVCLRTCCASSFTTTTPRPTIWRNHRRRLRRATWSDPVLTASSPEVRTGVGAPWSTDP